MHMYISGIRVERKLLDKKMRSKEQRAEREREKVRGYTLYDMHIIRAVRGRTGKRKKAPEGGGSKRGLKRRKI